MRRVYNVPTVNYEQMDVFICVLVRACNRLGACKRLCRRMWVSILQRAEPKVKLVSYKRTIGNPPCAFGMLLLTKNFLVNFLQTPKPLFSCTVTVIIVLLDVRNEFIKKLQKANYYSLNYYCINNKIIIS